MQVDAVDNLRDISLMTDRRAFARKTTLDKDLAKLGELGEATNMLARRLVAPGVALFFIVLAAFVASVIAGAEPRTTVIVAAAALAAYMAMNIGANDVANNVGPAVGAKALSMGAALAMAAIFEIAGALTAGGEVVETISREIISPEAVEATVLARLMLAALLSAALWINLATWIGAPVSTTHSIVGAVIGAGLAAAGPSAINWASMVTIAVSWVSSPILGGVIAAGFLAFVKTAIIYRDDRIAAARFWVPLLIAVMACAFAVYLTLIGSGAHFSGKLTALIGIAAFVSAWIAAHFQVRNASRQMEGRKQSLKRLFNLPLIVSAALLSFAHGANDVSNAVGPLAAIVGAVTTRSGDVLVGIPALWVMMIGAIGISVGLLLFGPRLVRMVGAEITKLNPMRAFCIALSAALTVIVASWFGLPVSSTHIALGAVFGVGFFREWYLRNSKQRRQYLERRAAERAARRPPSAGDAMPAAVKRSRPPRTEIIHRRLVRRAHVRTIVAAWLITVPVSALLAAAIFVVLDTVA